MARENAEIGMVIKLTADTSEFEKSVDNCIAKVKELIQLCGQADKLLSDDIRN